MSEITIQIGEKTVSKNRTFKALEALEDGKILRITYLEQTTINGEVIKSENKSYVRDYDFWKESDLGVAIMEMVDLDLREEDPSLPRQQ